MISTLSLSLRSKRFRGFRSKERGTRVKDCAKNCASKIAWSFLPSPSPPRSFIFWLSFHFSRGHNRSFFAPKPKGNACYAGYLSLGIIVCCCCSFPSFRCFTLCSAYPRSLCGQRRRGGKREKKNYSPFTPPPYPVRRLIAGYVHALYECLKQDIG